MNALILLLLLTIQTPSTVIVTKNIGSILEYYEKEEGISHQNIMLLSSLSQGDFKPTLEHIKNNFPHLQIKYAQSSKEHKSLCIAIDSDLIILIPSGILKLASSIFEYNFQSKVKNIFGTMTVEIDLNYHSIIEKHTLIFTTSIGD